MTRPATRDVAQRVRKLLKLPEDVRTSQWAVSVTRLTVLKSLCKEPDVANRFVTHIARLTLERAGQSRGRSSRPGTPEDLAHRAMMTEALAGMDAWRRRPTEGLRDSLCGLLARMRAEQNEYENIPWGAVRLVSDWDLLLFEYALSCVLGPARECGHWAYQTAKHYAERYTPSQGTGLISTSVPMVQDIADFWAREYDPIAEPARAGTTRKKAKETRSAKADRKAETGFSPRQGQFLAFIHLYRKLHRRSPAEADLVRFFGVTPPSAHGMIVRLEELGFLTREPGVGRSIRVTVPEDRLPPLEDVPGPEW